MQWEEPQQAPPTFDKVLMPDPETRPPGNLVFGRRRLTRALAPADGVIGTPPVLCPIPNNTAIMDIGFSVSNTVAEFGLQENLVIGVGTRVNDGQGMSNQLDIALVAALVQPVAPSITISIDAEIAP